jgi:hypothetical protein
MKSERELWILVHGTFAADASWTGPESDLSRALRATGRIDTESFRWSGSNSGVARARAGRELAALVAARKEHYPVICVVGHSHGGNVIRQACRDLPVGAIDKAMFLGTPFINAERRDLTQQEKAAPWLVAAAIGLYVWATISEQLMKGGIIIDFSILPKQTAILLGVFAVLGGLVATVARRAGAISEKNFAQRDRECRKKDYVFRVGLDEAALLLHTMSFLPNIGLRLMRFLIRTATVAAQHVLSPFYIIAIVGSLSVLTGDAGLLALFKDAITLLLLSIIMCLLLFLALALAWLPISALLRFTPASFGYEGFSSLIGLNLAVESAPWKTEAQEQHNYRVRFPNRKLTSLRHSGFYEDPAVIRVIAALARESKESLPGTITEVPPPRHLSNTPPKKWSVYVLPAFLLGIFSYALMAHLVNPFLAEMTAEEVPIVCEPGVGCEEVDSSVVDEACREVTPDGLFCVTEAPP